MTTGTTPVSEEPHPGLARKDPSAQTFTDRPPERVFDHKLFKMDRYVGSFELFGGGMSEPVERLVFERGDSVAALLFDAAHRNVILVRQFRLPVTLRGENGWILEPAAGIVEPGETPDEAMRAELQEETGYRVTDLIKIAEFFVSPGGTTERIFLYFAEVLPRQHEGEGGGLARDGENIRTEHVNVTDFLRMLENGELHDAKLIIGAQWLKSWLSARPPHEATASTPVECVVKHDSSGKSSFLRRRSGGSRPKIVGYRTGDIMNVRNIDVWVNPLNTDMMLDRFSDRTVSAKIRYFGAERNKAGDRLERDTISDELRREMGKRCFVAPAQFIDTQPGALKKFGVKRIYHVATSRGEFGRVGGVDLTTIEQCVDAVLFDIRYKYASVLIPMLGTGGAQFSMEKVAPLLLRRAIRFFKENPPSITLERVQFLPYSEVDAAIFAKAMKDLEKELEPLGADRDASGANAG